MCAGAESASVAVSASHNLRCVSIGFLHPLPGEGRGSVLLLPSVAVFAGCVDSGIAWGTGSALGFSAILTPAGGMHAIRAPVLDEMRVWLTSLSLYRFCTGGVLLF